ncbi:MAG: DUF2298 domain-containing protein, partial [Chloroflexi bacterium]|nr:DUF2298 domain-containing protein [Chloroflexota bacterium]
SRLGGQAASLVESVSGPGDEAAVAQRRVGVEGVLILAGSALLLGFGLTSIFTSSGVGSTMPIAAALLAIVLVTGGRRFLGARPDAPYVAFVAVMVAVSLMLVIGLDIFRVEGDIDRMNSIFKFYLQVWVMLALVAAYLLWRMAHGRRVPLNRLALPKQTWAVGLAALALGTAVYPILGTQDRLRDRFFDKVTPLTLDGTAYVEGAVYRDEEGPIDLEADFEGIRWLQQNVQGSPVIVEGVTPIYRWGGRVSINTGLPTVLGWQWHQEQQRWDYSYAVIQRSRDVDAIYGSPDPAEALSLLRDYGVSYVYVGQLERNYYPDYGIEKFSAMNELTPVFQNGQVTIYRVDDS